MEMMDWRYLAKALVLPPGGLLLLAALGLLLLRRWLRTGMLLAASALLGLWLLGTPWLGSQLSLLIGAEPPLPRNQWAALDRRAGAIVVLGAGRTGVDAGWGGDQPSALATERLRLAARLQRASGLPLLVSGGRPRGEAEGEALLSARVLAEDFGVAVRWQDNASRTTWENALYSARLLHAAGIRQVVLVTHAWHMPRARWCFEQQGLRVIAAPFGYDRGSASLLPDGQSLWQNGLLLNELAGRLLYPQLYALQ